MSAERVDCPVPWCEGEARGHLPRNEHDFHMGADVEGPMFLKAARIQIDDGPTGLSITVEPWDTETDVDGVLALARDAAAAVVWLLDQAVQLTAHNEARS